MIDFLDRTLVEAQHNEQLRLHGGAAGLRDPGLLESALARPVNRNAYAGGDVFELAAAYLVGIVKNHPFVDGNKRTGFAAADLFLFLNGWNLEADQHDVVVMVLAVAAGEIDETGAAMFFRDFCRPV